LYDEMASSRASQKAAMNHRTPKEVVVSMRYTFRAAVLFGLCAVASLAAETQPPVAPKRSSLAISIFATPPGAQPARSLECVVPFGPPVSAAAVAFSPDGKLLASGGYQEVLMWDLANARLLKRLGAGQIGDAVHAVAFHKDGKLLAVAEGTPHGPASVKLLDVQSGQVAASFQEPKDAIFSLAFSPDGKWLCGGGVDATLYVWSVAEKKSAAAIKGHGDWILGVCFSADGKLLASAGEDKTALVWEAGSWKRLSMMQETETIHGVALSPDGQFVALAVAGADSKLLRIRRRDNGDVVREIDLGVGAPLDVLWVAQTNRVCVPCSDKTIKVFDAGNWGQVANLAGHDNWVYRAAVSADGARLASVSADGTVRLWAPAESRPLATLAQLAPRSDEWLIATAPGYFAASAAAAIQWKAMGIATPPDKLPSILQNADLVKQVLAGGKPAPPAIP
jgi:WD40 repeat protein